jgi:hypothetical protein
VRRPAGAAGAEGFHVMRHCTATVLPLLCCALLLSSGCGEDKDKRHLTRVVNPPEIFGVWQMTDASRQLLLRDGYAEQPEQSYTIMFINDGTVKFNSVLDDVKGGTYTNCLGRWRLDHDRTVDNETPRANVIELQLLRTNDRYFRKLALTEEDEQVRLWNFYGDPDAKEYIEYERPGAKKVASGF